MSRTRQTANTALAADGCEEPQLAGTSDRRGAIRDTELGVDAADMRADRVRRDGQLAGDLGPGQVRGEVPQYPELAGAELDKAIFAEQFGAVLRADDAIQGPPLSPRINIASRSAHLPSRLTMANPPHCQRSLPSSSRLFRENST